MKIFWIISQYASTPKTGMGGRHYYLAKELAKQGHKVYLIAAGYTHLLRNPPKMKSSFKIEKIEGFNFIWIDMPKYSDAHDKKRILNWFLFAWKVLRLPKLIAEKPDIILASSPSLLTSWSAKKLADKFQAKYIFEVRDIWPLTLIKLGGYSKSHLFIKFLQWIEDKAYSDADIVISNLPNAVEHMVGRGMDRDKFCWIPNGFDQNEVIHAEPLSKKTLSQIPKDKFIVGYAGTLGIANSLNCFILAAKILQKKDEIAFVLVGSGKEKIVLEEMSKGLFNVFFIDAIPKQQMQTMLSMFNVCYLGWKDESLYRFGIAPNKLPEYMLSKKPILHSYSGSHDFVKLAYAGISVPAESPQAVAHAILELKNMTQERRNKMGKNGRKYALENLDYEKLAKTLSKVLD